MRACPRCSNVSSPLLEPASFLLPRFGNRPFGEGRAQETVVLYRYERLLFFLLPLPFALLQVLPGVEFSALNGRPRNCTCAFEWGGAELLLYFSLSLFFFLLVLQFSFLPLLSREELKMFFHPVASPH